MSNTSNTSPNGTALPFEGKVAIVTGGTRGIGFAIAKALQGAGAVVVVCGRKPVENPPTCEGRTAEFVSCDVRDAAACKALVDGVAERHGRLDILVNNAGGSPAVDAASVSPRFSESIIALNLTAPLHMSQAAHRWMSAQESGGAIVNIASVSAHRPSPGTAIYGAAKAGLVSLTTSLAQEWGPDVRVNAIIVGLIETENAEATYGSRAARDAIAYSTPMKRLGRGADVANAVLFLCGPGAGFVSGAALEVHGGGEPPVFQELIARHGTGDK